MAGSPLWRDRILAVVCWAAVSFMAAYYWAAPDPATPAESLLASDPLRAVEPTTAHSLPLILTGGLPLVLVSLRIIPGGKDLMGKALNEFQRPPILAALLTALAVLLAPPLIPLGLSTPAQELAVTVVAVLIILWFFYRREGTEARQLLAVGLWLLALIVSRQTLLLFPGNVDLMAASWRTRILFVVHAGAYALGLLGPVLLLFPRVCLLAPRRAPPKTAALLAMAFGVIALAAWLLLQAGVGDRLRMLLILRTLLLLVILFAFSYVISPPDECAHQAVVPLPDISPRAYKGLALLGLAVFSGLALIVNRNLLPSLNPDGIAYMTIARSYAEGKGVVRGCWSPLISWVLAAPISAGVQPNAAFRATLVLSALVMMVASLGLARNLGLGRAASVLACWTLGLVILASGGFNSLTPDLLGGAIVAIYLLWMSRPSLLERPFCGGVVAGSLAALAYYAKYYNFTFVLPHLVTTGLLLATHRQRRRSIAIATGLALLTLATAVLPWLFALRGRYGYFTLTTSARINRSIVVRPEVPWWDRRLVATPSDVLFPWEDPDPELSELRDWSPFHSVGELQFQVRLIKGNLWWLVGRLASETGPLPILAMGISAALVLIDWHSLQERLRQGWLLLSACLYTAGYMLTHASQFRYFFALMPVILVITFVMLERALRALLTAVGNHAAARLPSIGLLVLASVALVHWDGLQTALTRRMGPCFQDGAASMAPYLEAPIAGSDRQVNYVSYLARLRTFGVLSPQTRPAEADAQLREFGVRTYLAPKGSPLAWALTSDFGYSLVSSAPMCGVDYDILRVPE